MNNPNSDYDKDWIKLGIKDKHHVFLAVTDLDDDSFLQYIRLDESQNSETIRKTNTLGPNRNLE